MKSALLVIDVQNDYFKNGKMELYKAEETAEKIKKIMNIFREKSEEIIFIKHISKREGANFFLENTYGVEINESVKALEGEKIIEKNYPNSFRETKLLEYLKEKNINQLFITGMMTHMCVEATVRASFDYEIKNYLIGEACTTKDLYFNKEKIEAKDVHKTVLAELDKVYTQVLNLDEVKNYL